MRLRLCSLGLSLFLFDAAWAEDATFKRSKLPATQTSREIPVQLVLSDVGLAVREARSGAARFEIPYGAIHKVSYGLLDGRRVALVPVYGISALLLKGQSHWLVIETGTGADLRQTVLRLHKDEFRGVIAALNARSGRRVEALDPANTALDPTAGSHDEDETAPFPIDRVRDALKPAMEQHSCKVRRTAPGRVECRRGLKPRVGGGGGETVVAELDARGQETRVRIQTRKGLGRNWSSPIYREMRSRLEGGPRP